MPTLSNTSTNRNTKTTSSSPSRAADATSILPHVASKSPSWNACGDHVASPNSAPATAVPKIPASTAIRTPYASNPAVSSKPNSASTVFGSRRFPSVTMVAGLATIIPALRNPISAMNSPMPLATAAYISRGMESTIGRAAPASASTKNASPERNTAPNAVSHGTPIP